MNTPITSSKKWLKGISSYEPERNLTSELVNIENAAGFVVDSQNPVTIEGQEYEIQTFVVDTIQHASDLIKEMSKGGYKIYPHAAIKTTNIDYSSLSEQELNEFNWAFTPAILSEDIEDLKQREQAIVRLANQKKGAQIQWQERIEALPLKDSIVFTCALVKHEID